MSSEVENPTIIRNPNRSLWEAAVTGHRTELGQLAARCWPAVYVWLRASGAEAEQQSYLLSYDNLHILYQIYFYYDN